MDNNFENNTEFNDFLNDVEKFNETISATENVVDESNNFETPNDLSSDNPPNENTNQNNEQGELREGLKQVFTGELVITIIDTIFPKSMLLLLSFIDKDFGEIELQSIQLDEAEKEMYKPVGEYIAKILIDKINPVVFFSALYIYRTSLAIYIQYNHIKQLKKHKTMPLKKSKQKSEKTNETNNLFSLKSQIKNELKNEIKDLQTQIADLSNYIRNIQITDPSEARELKKELDDLKSQLKEKQNTQSVSNTPPVNKAEKENDNTSKKRKYNIDPNKLKEKLEKMRAAREKKKNEQFNQNNANNQNTLI